MSTRRSPRFSWIAFSGCLTLALASIGTWAQSLEVIQLKHRSAQEVIPVLQPLLESGAAISGQDYTLFVRTSPSTMGFSGVRAPGMRAIAAACARERW